MDTQRLVLIDPAKLDLRAAITEALVELALRQSPRMIVFITDGPDEPMPPIRSIESMIRDTMEETHTLAFLREDARTRRAAPSPKQLFAPPPETRAQMRQRLGGARKKPQR